MFGIFNKVYVQLYKEKIKQEVYKTISFLLEKNITWGDALSLKKVGPDAGHIVFSQWSFIDQNMIKRRDFSFHGLLDHASVADTPLFSDLGDDVFIPKPEREYPLQHYLKLSDVK